MNTGQIVAALLLSVSAIAIPQQVMAWGKTGHRVIADIGEKQLSGEARANVELILGVETLAESSNWPDEMRSSDDVYWKKTANPYHYVTVPAGKTYAEVGAPQEGDAYVALEKFAKILRDPGASRDEKQKALRFAVHIIGDLHQPLHAGNGTDKGGNDVKVSFFGKSTNLHSVWDSAMVDYEQLSYTDYERILQRRLTPEHVIAWSTADANIWIAESAALRDKIYPKSDDISYRYIFEHKDQMDERLAQGGVRVAAWLNSVFSKNH